MSVPDKEWIYDANYYNFDVNDPAVRTCYEQAVDDYRSDFDDVVDKIFERTPRFEEYFGDGSDPVLTAIFNKYDPIPYRYHHRLVEFFNNLGFTDYEKYLCKNTCFMTTGVHKEYHYYFIYSDIRFKGSTDSEILTNLQTYMGDGATPGELYTCDPTNKETYGLNPSSYQKYIDYYITNGNPIPTSYDVDNINNFDGTIEETTDVFEKYIGKRIITTHVIILELLIKLYPKRSSLDTALFDALLNRWKEMNDLLIQLEQPMYEEGSSIDHVLLPSESSTVASRYGGRSNGSTDPWNIDSDHCTLYKVTITSNAPKHRRLLHALARTYNNTFNDAVNYNFTGTDLTLENTPTPPTITNNGALGLENSTAVLEVNPVNDTTLDIKLTATDGDGNEQILDFTVPYECGDAMHIIPALRQTTAAITDSIPILGIECNIPIIPANIVIDSSPSAPDPIVLTQKIGIGLDFMTFTPLPPIGDSTGINILTLNGSDYLNISRPTTKMEFESSFSDSNFTAENTSPETITSTTLQHFCLLYVKILPYNITEITVYAVNVRSLDNATITVDVDGNTNINNAIFATNFLDRQINKFTADTSTICNQQFKFNRNRNLMSRYSNFTIETNESLTYDSSVDFTDLISWRNPRAFSQNVLEYACNSTITSDINNIDSVTSVEDTPNNGVLGYANPATYFPVTTTTDAIAFSIEFNQDYVSSPDEIVIVDGLVLEKSADLDGFNNPGFRVKGAPAAYIHGMFEADLIVNDTKMSFVIIKDSNVIMIGKDYVALANPITWTTELNIYAARSPIDGTPEFASFVSVSTIDTTTTGDSYIKDYLCQDYSILETAGGVPGCVPLTWPADVSTITKDAIPLVEGQPFYAVFDLSQPDVFVPLFEINGETVEYAAVDALGFGPIGDFNNPGGTGGYVLTVKEAGSVTNIVTSGSGVGMGAGASVGGIIEITSVSVDTVSVKLRGFHDLSGTESIVTFDVSYTCGDTMDIKEVVVKNPLPSTTVEPTSDRIPGICSVTWPADLSNITKDNIPIVEGQSFQTTFNIEDLNSSKYLFSIIKNQT